MFGWVILFVYIKKAQLTDRFPMPKGDKNTNMAKCVSWTGTEQNFIKDESWLLQAVLTKLATSFQGTVNK